MKQSPKKSWITFSAGIAVLVIMITWISVATWHRLGELRRDLSTLHGESFHLADRLEAELLTLNETLLQYAEHHRPDEAEEVRKKAAEVDLWIQRQISKIKRTRERELLVQIRTAFADYHKRVSALVITNSVEASLVTPPLVDSLEREAAPILAMYKSFDEAQRLSLEKFGEQSHSTARLLQRLLLVGATLLICLSIVVVILIYRSTIAPLRAKLVQAHAIAERQEKLASLGTLAAGVAHEIRNPLTAINVRLHSLRKALSSGSSEHEDAVIIGAEIQRLERIVRNFLQFAKPSEPEFVEMTADALMENIFNLFRAQFETRGIVFKLDAPPGLRVKIDPQQIEQVLINLARNAAESIEQRGTVTLRAYSSKGTLRGRKAVVLEVSDTGRGIPPEIQKRLFDPFFTTKSAGTGLGLSIAARIVEIHGGSIQYRSEGGRGTTFMVLLPALE